MRCNARCLASLLVTFGLTGCGLHAYTDPQQDIPAPPPVQHLGEATTFTPARECGGNFTPEQRMYLELVRKMVKQGQFYAAIAHLDELEKNSAAAPQIVYLRAEALRGADQREAAEKLYRLLLSGCMAGYGLHGLGLLAAEAGQLEQAEDNLARACRERPVDADAHNDLGMVYLLRGRHSDARKEFMTALQLDRGNRLPAENLIVLMLVEKQDTQAQHLAQLRGFNPQDMERLAQRAQKFKEPSQLRDKPPPPPPHPSLSE